MKLAALILGLSAALAGCDISNPVQDMAKKNPDSKARTIAAQHGCMGCHTVANSIVGPAWRLVAESYQSDPLARENIVNSIKHGSRGRWESITSNQVMPGFADRISDADITVLADYILSLNK